MEEKRIFDLVLVKFGRFLVNCGNILVKSVFFIVFFGIDVGPCGPQAGIQGAESTIDVKAVQPVSKAYQK